MKNNIKGTNVFWRYTIASDIESLGYEMSFVSFRGITYVDNNDKPLAITGLSTITGEAFVSVPAIEDYSNLTIWRCAKLGMKEILKMGFMKKAYCDKINSDNQAFVERLGFIKVGETDKKVEYKWQ